MLPTRHWVSTPQRGWWANCAWCSLAIAAALRTDVQISTGDGGEGGATGVWDSGWAVVASGSADAFSVSAGAMVGQPLLPMRQYFIFLEQRRD